MDPLCQDYEQCTPFHRACEGGDINLVHYLMKEMMKYTPQNEIIYSQNKDGKRSLHIAAHFGQLQLVNFFISEMHCDPNI